MKNKNKALINRHVQDVLYVIGGKWRGGILASLCDQPKRFNDLKRDLQGITSRTLISELQFLEMNKMVSRVVYDARPAIIEYSLTDHGKSIEPIILAIGEWGVKHRQKIMKS